MKEVIKFGFVGVVNTVLSLLIYYVFIWINKDWYILGTVAGYIISSIVGYFLNKIFVFQKKELKHAPTIVKYYIVYLSALLLNVLLMELWVGVLHLSEVIAPILTLCFTVPYNFLFSKFWVFKEKEKHES